MGHSSLDPAFHELRPWNEGRLIGAKRALKQQQVWAIRFWLDQHTPVDPPDVRPSCPCCGGHMVVIETFERSSRPRAPPHGIHPTETTTS